MSTRIEWVQGVDGARGTTWNPVTGCDRVSQGCDHCYAATMARRLKAMGSPRYQRDGRPSTSGPGFGVSVHEDVITAPLRWRTPRTVFVNSMSDVFHAEVGADAIARIWAVMAATPQHTYQILTKRHGRMRSLLNSLTFRASVARAVWELAMADNTTTLPDELTWPLPNVWVGVSAETQRWADIRIPALLETRAALRFISAEPLLGPLRLAPDDHTGHDRDHHGTHTECSDCSTPEQPVAWRTQTAPPLDWVIIGGESGPDARPVDLDWIRGLRDDAHQAGAAVFIKQLGSAWARGMVGSSTGADPAHWPEDLRVQEMPTRRRPPVATGPDR
ncbi:DUF5131 family protein [Streptomonospora litoralis]|uniref:Phage protein Gp37/Gp68 n=1 Tax=Streptomonospora litoralis TaxID=2498135 RepID=A0A4V0ZKG0_9ACTN|nr:phage Gp37/Gp68 family protein [Streptomonospora litoralis]QBI56852.1 Phage protein Gp37/Gp68 [Streptomonospora litoralis]